MHNIRIIGVPEEEKKEKGYEKIFEEIVVENFPNMGKEIATQIQEAHKVPYRINPRRNTPRHILFKLTKIKFKEKILKAARGTSLVAQWLRVCLPMQGTRVRSLVQASPTCRRATKPVHHNYRACALEPVSHNYRARMPQLLKPTCLEPMLHNKRSHPNERPA